ncbi:hypothetical protein JFK97_06680 [Chromobacterium phragmitis]|uniref:phage regulatory CII family protein n=1 Tax=Chromobacterium amazonense TaxID=1382803 RepID=UPI0021B7B0B2|nr:phage regulatory CII family protein [Chromobacterium amazonense]MBM2884072.1 hypothetical protein [Chromobacterium amazonense]
MNVNDAAHKTVYAAGGPKVVAARMDASESVIRAKANPNDDSRWFYLPEAMELMSLTGDHRILQAMADEFGYLLTQIPDEVDSADRALLGMLTDAVKGNTGESEIRRGLSAIRGFIGADLRKKVNRLQGYLAALAQAIDD